MLFLCSNLFAHPYRIKTPEPSLIRRRRNRLAHLLESENVIYRQELENSVETFEERRQRMIETVRICYV